MKPIIRIFSGIVLLAISAFGIFHGARAALAQTTYLLSKHGTFKNNPKGIFRRCEAAHRMYPYNYYFCIWTAETAFNNRLDANGNEIPELINLARYWCDKGLELNFYNSQLRRLKTCLLYRESINEAIKFWADYVDWHFWDPYNHAVLVELYADSGDFARAVESIKFVKGSKHYEQASEYLREAWQREKTPPPEK